MRAGFDEFLSQRAEAWKIERDCRADGPPQAGEVRSGDASSAGVVDVRALQKERF
jgi:hypothetical protein